VAEAGQNLFHIIYNVALEISHEATEISRGIEKVARSAGIKVRVFSRISLTVFDHDFKRTFEI
jgi:hypothetical protein